jgi:hypothetical protein
MICAEPIGKVRTGKPGSQFPWYVGLPEQAALLLALSKRLKWGLEPDLMSWIISEFEESNLELGRYEVPRINYLPPSAFSDPSRFVRQMLDNIPLFGGCEKYRKLLSGYEFKTIPNISSRLTVPRIVSFDPFNYGHSVLWGWKNEDASKLMHGDSFLTCNAFPELVINMKGRHNSCYAYVAGYEMRRADSEDKFVLAISANRGKVELLVCDSKDTFFNHSCIYALWANGGLEY